MSLELWTWERLLQWWNPPSQYEIRIGCLTIELVVGDITALKADVIVNSTNKNLNLSNGALSATILKEAGPELQEKCSALSPINQGQVVETSGGQARCKSIYHCCLPDKFSSEVLTEMVIECVRMAKDKYRCIAFPALGTGKLKYPREDVVSSFVTAIGQSQAKLQGFKTRRILLVVHKDDERTFLAFEGYFNRHHKQLPDQENRKPVEGSKDFTRPREVVFGFPSTWTAPYDVFSHVALHRGSDEWMHVEKHFLQSMKEKVIILKITRVQNHYLYGQYCLYKDRVASLVEAEDIQVERHLWHGTSADAIEKIVESNFNRSLSGANGTMYGNGTYFSTTSEYAHTYSSKDNQERAIRMRASSCQMIRAKVATGKYCKGERSLKQAPQGHHSVVNNETDPTIFVTFQDASAYPEHVVQYILQS